MITAQVICDSIAPGGSRLTTMELESPRSTLAEFNTHRVFSRNSASSRAIPVQKILERVREDPFVPIRWEGNRPGMQAGEPLTERDVKACQAVWANAVGYAAAFAEQLHGVGLHKQWANRLLEPFMWHQVVVTSSEWQNFFDQRVSPLAQPEMHELARAMLTVYNESKPLELLAPAANHLLSLDDGKKRFLDVMASVTKAYSLCGTLDEAAELRTEIAFF